jgi:putative two-component system response regulator
VTQLLTVDDEELLRRWAHRVLTTRGYECDVAADAPQARDMLTRRSYDLALLDVRLPGESGMDLLAHVRRFHPGCAAVMVSGEDSTELALAAIEMGAFGYLIKPVTAGELVITVANGLRRRRLELGSTAAMVRLNATVEAQKSQLLDAVARLRSSEDQVLASNRETILRLARIVELRDGESGRHVERMSGYCAAIARAAGAEHDRCEMVRTASELHDIGKLSIPDSILLKPGALTREERTVVETHAQVGYEMLAGSASRMMQLGAVIARTHHECWDGTGYPRGLVGLEIPWEGRVAAIADVYDALTSDRVYRAAIPPADALETMRRDNGTRFDPELGDAFFSVLPEIEEIRSSVMPMFADEPPLPALIWR